jgi:hypothetical protein
LAFKEVRSLSNNEDLLDLSLLYEVVEVEPLADGVSN